MSSNQLAVTSPVLSDEEPLTLEALRGAMPKRQKHNITQHLVDQINNLVTDPEARNVFRENIISYSSVMSDPNVKLSHYIQAVKYVSYQLMGDTNEKAWTKTFPDRYQRLLKMEKSADHIRATVSNYNRNKVVNTIREMSLIPSWVLNQDMYQKALNVQANLMITASSEKVRTDAANSLLTHLKMPETTKLRIDVGVVQDDSLRELREATLSLVNAQTEQIKAGNMTAAEIARGKLIQGVSKRVDD